MWRGCWCLGAVGISGLLAPRDRWRLGAAGVRTADRWRPGDVGIGTADRWTAGVSAARGAAGCRRRFGAAGCWRLQAVAGGRWRLEAAGRGLGQPEAGPPNAVIALTRAVTALLFTVHSPALRRLPPLSAPLHRSPLTSPLFAPLSADSAPRLSCSSPPDSGAEQPLWGWLSPAPTQAAN